MFYLVKDSSIHQVLFFAFSDLLQDYFKQSGLVTLFPKVASYIINPNRPTFRNQKSTMEGIFLLNICILWKVYLYNVLKCLFEHVIDQAIGYSKYYLCTR